MTISVYCVFESVPYEMDHLLEIFLNEDNAIEYLGLLKKDKFSHYSVEEYPICDSSNLTVS